MAVIVCVFMFVCDHDHVFDFCFVLFFYFFFLFYFDDVNHHWYAIDDDDDNDDGHFIKAHKSLYC